jgi:hypothetical protein
LRTLATNIIKYDSEDLISGDQTVELERLTIITPEELAAVVKAAVSEGDYASKVPIAFPFSNDQRLDNVILSNQKVILGTYSSLRT